jgi:tagatose 6-phosphate kinase
MILCVCPNPSVDIYVWLDAIHAGKVNRATREIQFPGGKGVHVALACAEMACEVTILGFWGGPTGDWIRNQCLKYSIRSDGIELAEWSRTCQSFKSDSEYDETEILGVGPAITSSQQDRLDHLLQQFLPSVSCISMSGSWPAGASPDAYARLISICNEQGKAVFIDCTGEQLENALPEKPFFIHLNTSEARDLFGDLDPEKLALKLSKHCTLAAITEGKKGLYLTDGKDLLHGHVAVNQCFSAVGSGDCLVAGLMMAHLKKMSLQDSARLGVACGAANCVREELGMLNKQDVEALIGQVIIEKKN